jgi:hypothetical protein
MIFLSASLILSRGAIKDSQDGLSTYVLIGDLTLI